MENEKICVTKEYFRDIVIYAFRYAITGKSYAGALFTDWMIDNMEIMSDSDLTMMIKEIKEDIENGLIKGTNKMIWKAFCDTIEKIKW